MLHRRTFNAAAALTLILSACAAAASAHVEPQTPPAGRWAPGDHKPVLRSWIVEESCSESYRDSYHANDEDWSGGEELRNLERARPRVAGRFGPGRVTRVTMLLKYEGETKRQTAKVSKRNRFAADLASMPTRISFRWRGPDGDVHRTPFYGPLHSGCEEEPPPDPADRGYDNVNDPVIPPGQGEYRDRPSYR